MTFSDMRTHQPLWAGAFLAMTLCSAACGTPPAPTGAGTSIAGDSGKDPVIPASSKLQSELWKMEPTRPAAPSDAQKRLSASIDQYYQQAQTRRLYVHLDKPLYQPGETMWFRIWELSSPTLASGHSGHGLMTELVSPKGATVLQKRLRMDAGVATNDFILPAEVQGGEYIIRVTSDRGDRIERKLIVSSYQPPQVKKKLEFLRKAYGAGDKVAAALALSRATGEPLANRDATAVITLDEVDIARFKVRTDGAGNSVVRFDLPKTIARGDGLLTILIEDGGVTESIQKRIPILAKELDFQLFPEGGDLVTGLPGRVYFIGKNLIGKPADVEGRVVDGSGRAVATFISFHNGLGRFDITPQAGASYFAEITKPAGITQRIPLPAAQASGCVMQAVDDALGKRDDVRVAVFCTAAQTVIATSVLREKRLGDVAVDVAAAAPTVIGLPVPAGSQGAVRVTLFNDALQPMAERLIYRGLGADLAVSVTADRSSYAPRDQVALAIQTKDLAGKPVQADLSLAVVDDTVISFADDKSAHLLARIYLEAEMPGQEIEEPNFYFAREPKSAAAIDLVLGTQGWRRFEWQPVLAPVVTDATVSTTKAYDFADDDIQGELVRPEGRQLAPEAVEPEPGAVERPRAKGGAKPARPVVAAKLAKPAPPPAAPRPAAVQPVMPKGQPAQDRARRDDNRKVAEKKKEVAAPRNKRPPRDERRPRPMEMDMDGAGDAAGMDMGDVLEEEEAWGRRAQQANQDWAAVREFPAPTYEGRYDGPRNDFRETIYWQPSIKTDRDGKATVRFYASDAVTSFRAVAEGASQGGLPGRGDLVIQSKLPVSLAVTMPLEVSAGDLIELPVVLANETNRAYDVNVASYFGPAFRVRGGVPGKIKLNGGQRQSFFAKLEVVGDGKKLDDGRISIGIDTANLKDEVEKTVRVVPLGFPQEISLSGTVETSARHNVSLAAALPGSIEASLTMYPSPLATILQGTEAIIREPTGCFEQASSANYPNIMVMAYLEGHDAADPALVERTSGLLDRGYKKLVGYESPQKGYEWFGGDPGHEALTAYGLMEFADMKAVYGDVNVSMIDRTKTWLKSRRDGKGGFQRNSRALDSFGGASEEVTNGYITYALAEAGERDLGKELAYQQRIASETQDPYLLAMAANTLVLLEPKAPTTQAALTRLAGLQKPGGVWSGANHSITRSGGVALDIETTSLAVMALVRAGQAHSELVRDGIGWLNNNRGGFGGYGSTQSTVLALKAMTRYAEASRVTQASGTATLLINGKQAGQIAFEKGQKDPIVFDDISSALQSGNNAVELRLASGAALPYSMAITYRSKMPASSPETKVAVTAALAKANVPLGEGVRMKVSVRNVTREGIPMTLARIGLPGGLTFQTWQLKELRDKKIIDFYETREREVILYFRSMAPNATKDVDLDLLARVPGTFVAPASRAYLYYTDEFKHWAEPVRVTVGQ